MNDYLLVDPLDLFFVNPVQFGDIIYSLLMSLSDAFEYLLEIQFEPVAQVSFDEGC
jgi:hypothetical protein